MMLLFYSYYKQATLGPCTLAKPAFWDVVNKAKWNAWTSLGQMSKDQAMKRFIKQEIELSLNFMRKVLTVIAGSPQITEF
jgi:acyl-CoA-binding protein